MSKMSVLNQEQLRNEKAMVESFQVMFKMFEEGQKEADNKANFLNKKNEFERLFLLLKAADDGNSYGRNRDFDHSINYKELHSHLEEINEMERGKNWDWEFIDSCIEDVESELRSLESASYDEFFEDTFSVNNI